MKLSMSALAICFSLAAAPAFAVNATSTSAIKATKMSDAQLDNIVAGQVMNFGSGLIDVQIGDVTVLQDVPIRILNNSVNDNTVQIPVAATVGAAVGVLGNASAMAQQFGAAASHRQ